MTDVLTLYTVYAFALDYPTEIVVREFHVGPDGLIRGGDVVIRNSSLEAVRSALAQRGLYRLPRDAGDAPAIVETWL